MKTIAIFCGYALPHLGGIERYIDNLSNQLINKKYRVIIICSNYNNSKTIEKHNGIIYMRLPVFSPFKNRYPIINYFNKEYRHVIKELNTYSIDRIIVNTRFHLTSHVGARYAKKHNIPVYLIEHGSNFVTLDNKLIDFFANTYERFLTLKIKNKIKGFYGVSEACGEWLKKIKINPDGVWYNSIDIDQKLPKKVKHSKITFLYAGRLIKQKGVENILNAFSKLEKKHNNIMLYIAGDGPEFNIYKNTFKSENIIFLGKLKYDELLKYYAKSDVFLYPPLWPEGLPTSILEAGLMKCAIISTSQGGIKEIIDNKNGIIVKENVESLRVAMEKLVDDEDYREELQKEIYETILNKFSWQVTAEKILKDMNI